MKRILTVLLLLLIGLLFLYCAHLDGVLHISAFALNKCEFCEYLEEHDLAADITNFPTNIQQHPQAAISYELALYDRVVFGAKGKDRIARSVLMYEVPFVHCPQCGRLIDWDKLLEK